jgi:hypothetical protein
MYEIFKGSGERPWQLQAKFPLSLSLWVAITSSFLMVLVWNGYFPHFPCYFPCCSRKGHPPPTHTDDMAGGQQWLRHWLLICVPGSLVLATTGNLVLAVSLLRPFYAQTPYPIIPTILSQFWARLLLECRDLQSNQVSLLYISVILLQSSFGAHFCFLKKIIIIRKFR